MIAIEAVVYLGFYFGEIGGGGGGGGGSNYFGKVGVFAWLEAPSHASAIWSTNTDANCFDLN